MERDYLSPGVSLVIFPPQPLLRIQPLFSCECQLYREIETYYEEAMTQVYLWHASFRDL